VVAERLEIIDEVEAGHLDHAWSELPLPKALSQEEAAGELPAWSAAATSDEEPVLTESGEAVPLRVAQRIRKLATNQKIVLAIKGGKEERTLLIREANRLIQVNVIRNGRITEGEVAFIAQMRTVADEVIRIIANNRDWMKKYAIVKALVMNPKTPPALALNLLKRLIDIDLKLLVRDKNVPELLRREAKRYLEAKSPRG
jgi:hypothetical protein